MKTKKTIGKQVESIQSDMKRRVAVDLEVVEVFLNLDVCVLVRAAVLVRELGNFIDHLGDVLQRVGARVEAEPLDHQVQFIFVDVVAHDLVNHELAVLLLGLLLD